MTLIDYLTEAGISQREFSERLGVTKQAVSRLCLGGGVSPGVAKRIRTLTRGRVKLEPEADHGGHNAGQAQPRKFAILRRSPRR